jgi:hypothetical protein
VPRKIAKKRAAENLFSLQALWFAAAHTLTFPCYEAMLNEYGICWHAVCLTFGRV